MEKDRQEILDELLNKLDQLAYVKPEEIPGVDLYMDQVLSFINDRTRYLTRNPEEDKMFTKTMINNYAKTKILPPPVKKKYSKDHIMLLLLIYYFKGVLSVNDTGELLGKITEKYFGNTGEIAFQDIYEEVFQLEEGAIDFLKRDIAEKFHIAEGTFEGAPEEGREFFKTFAFICLLSYDVFMKKLMIEKLVDECCKKEDKE
ncbi:MAG: DUF1836 domain-containing protein [Lachnospiraceae bacterium]|nr:DUF1836 domain-containing protein [Lachnospiraceae bacterium]